MLWEAIGRAWGMLVALVSLWQSSCGLAAEAKCCPKLLCSKWGAVPVLLHG